MNRSVIGRKCFMCNNYITDERDYAYSKTKSSISRGKKFGGNTLHFHKSCYLKEYFNHNSKSIT